MVKRRQAVRMGGEALMAMGQRRPRGQKKQWPAGEYTLLTDSQTAEDGVMYSKGDTFVQGEREAMR
jgi:hypothetical protein